MERELKMEYENIKERKGAGTILRAGAALALVAALAACGGGSSGTPGGPPNCEDDEMLNDAGTACVAKVIVEEDDDNDAELTGQASRASRAAVAASVMAQAAANDAARVNVNGSGANTALASMQAGNSAQAAADARTIRQAEATLAAQLVIARAQLAEIKRIIAGVPSSETDLLEDLRTDEAAAEGAVTLILGLQAGLADHLQAVATFHAHGSPELHEAAVAVAVRNALATAGAQSNSRVNAGTSGTGGAGRSTVPPGSANSGKIGFEGPPGLMKISLTEFTEPGAENTRNKGIDVSGKPLTDFVRAFGGNAGDNLLASVVNADTATIGNLRYKGVLGRLVCQVANAQCKASDGKLNGKPQTAQTQGTWFFVPVDPSLATDDTTGFDAGDTAYEGRYLKRGGNYVEYDDYADYGYWLTTDRNTVSDPNDDTVTITATSASPNDRGIASRTDSNGYPLTAKYNGHALGIAAVDTFGSTGDRTTRSGEFTADVELTAKFDATPSLEGTIDNFGGVAAGQGWSVDLDEAGLVATGSLATGSDTRQTFGEINGQRDTNVDPGSWTAQAYGTLPIEQGAHPIGFHGTFWADFRNGRAAGGYAAERIER